jgi:hypothetical protein
MEDAMDCAEYRVYPANAGGWFAQLNHREAGPYNSLDMALRVAISEILRRRKSGQAARLTVKDARGAVCAERCLCKLFFERCPLLVS